MSNLNETLMLLRHDSELRLLAQDVASLFNFVSSQADVLEGVKLTISDPFMTAVQYADHNELDTEAVCLNTLGKIAKRLAGENYSTISHARFGHVGYLQVSVWNAALVKYFEDRQEGMTVRQYTNLVGVEVSKTDRYALEFLAGEYSRAHSKPVTYGASTCRHPSGEPLFLPSVIDQSMAFMATVMTLHDIITEHQQ